MIPQRVVRMVRQQMPPMVRPMYFLKDVPERRVQTVSTICWVMNLGTMIWTCRTKLTTDLLSTTMVLVTQMVTAREQTTIWVLWNLLANAVLLPLLSSHRSTKLSSLAVLPGAGTDASFAAPYLVTSPPLVRRQAIIPSKSGSIMTESIPTSDLPMYSGTTKLRSQSTVPCSAVSPRRTPLQ